MAALAETHPTLLDLAKRTDSDGMVADVVEILNETNEMLLDMVWQEGNLPTGHRTTIRTGIPRGTWRKLYGAVMPTKSTTAQVTDNCGMLEAYGEVDKALADLNGNTAAWRLSEEMPQIEGLNQDMAETLIYGDEGQYPERFTGFFPRMDDLTADNAENLLDAGGTGSDMASILLCVWGPNSGYGIIPKGSTAGLQMKDLGEQTIGTPAGGYYQGYRTHYRWDGGLTMRDWRYFVRIHSIDRSTLTADASSGANLINLMYEAMELVPNMNGRAAFYMDRTIRTKVRQQASAKKDNLTITEIGGIMIQEFHGVPLRRVDAMKVDEAAL